jgi:hypothetical protein
LFFEADDFLRHASIIAGCPLLSIGSATHSPSRRFIFWIPCRCLLTVESSLLRILSDDSNAL